ncbi:MAG: CoA transferase [Acidobacteria bacterium]|nr:CoA transferase [Acidobacteriota bacterium]
MTRPLEGVRILAVSQFGAGPYGTLMLADLGAEIIKIEDPGTNGDVSRGVPPSTIENDSLYFQCFNRNKRSLQLDLGTPEGMEIFHRLVSISHGVFNNLRGDVPAKLGITFDSLKMHNPAIVCCSLSAYGRTGAAARMPGYDPLMQASEGYMSLTGGPDDGPIKCGVSVIDFAAGLAAAFGMMAGIHSATRTGVGCDVDVSLRDTALSMLNYYAVWYLNLGRVPERMADSAHAVLTPAQTFRTRDGHIVIFCAKEKFWELLCAALDKKDWASDPRFHDFAARSKNKTDLLALLHPVIMARTTAEWLTLLEGKVPCAPVRTLAEALDDPAVVEQEMIVEVDHPHFGKVREVGSPVKFSGDQPQHHAAPALGADTDSILQSYLSYSASEIAALRSRGVI